MSLYWSPIRAIKDIRELSVIREHQRHGFIGRFGKSKQIFYNVRTVLLWLPDVFLGENYKKSKNPTKATLKPRKIPPKKENIDTDQTAKHAEQQIIPPK
ncbi:hypothetical protein [Endozoicomonas sp. ONNA2]|uniref:hypothetical protein n=1 Tax=Endozoicomonas sp. ONNA2 TaxID=2828741 RepID=UPI002148C304|nr:hypothetical protein [Endozoicomonas sp. ONNA2]